MTTTNITTYKTGTTQEILNLDPSIPGIVAISTDTNSMFVSNGTGWSETGIHKRLGLQHTLDSGDIIGETPILHFDANDRNSMKTSRGTTCSNGDEVAEWHSQSSVERMIQDVHSRPKYISQDGNSNPVVFCDVFDGMFLDKSISPCRSGDMSVVLVYTPTREDHERVYTGPGDNTYSSTVPGGRYSYSKFQTQYATSFYEQIFTTNNIRSYGNTSDCLFFSLYQYANDDTVRLYHTGGYNSYFARLDGRYDKTPLTDAPEVDDYHHYNNNYRGIPQIVSARAGMGTGVNSTHMCMKMHTYHPSNLNIGYKIHDTTIKSPNPILHGFNIGGRGHADQRNTYLSPTGYHEILIFDSYLSDRDLDMLGQHLNQKWTTRIWDLTI